MYRIKWGLLGISPILFNAWTSEAKRKLDAGSTGGKMSLDERIEEAQQKVYRNPDGLFIPAQNIESCLVNGAKRAMLKRGRAGLAGYLEATCFVEERELPLTREGERIKEPDGIHEVMGRRGGNAVIIRRPILNTWQLAGTFLIVDDGMDAVQIKQALEASGLLSGLCDWRPKYGRFQVTEFEVQG